MLQCVTAGESHGSAIVAVLSGLPAGMEFSTAQLAAALKRRRQGYGRGTRQKVEEDEVLVVSGMRHGRTLGSPLVVEIRNSEWQKWKTVMNPDAVNPKDLLFDAGRGDEQELPRNKILTRPRPGHADLAGMIKYGFEDARNVLERASARETAARVVLGTLAEALLEQVAHVQLVSHVVSLGGVTIPDSLPMPQFGDSKTLDASPVRCFDRETTIRMMSRIDEAKKIGDTLGGVVEVIAYGVPLGLGSYVSHERRLDARLAFALVSIQAVKGVEIGRAFQQSALPGSQAHDSICLSADVSQQASASSMDASARFFTVGELTRSSNLAGGIEGGMSNGCPIVVRAAVKPISTVPGGLPTVDLATGQKANALHQRSDTTAVVPAALIAQAEVALVLADALLEKTGGDSVAEAKRNLDSYLETVRKRTCFE